MVGCRWVQQRRETALIVSDGPAGLDQPELHVGENVMCRSADASQAEPRGMRHRRQPQTAQQIRTEDGPVRSRVQQEIILIQVAVRPSQLDFERWTESAIRE